MVGPQERGENHSQEISRIERRETEFPRAIDGRMEAILSSFNNAPTATIILLLTRSLMDTHSLVSLFKGVHRGSAMADVADGTAPGYCHHTLYPVGLVVEEARILHFGAEKVVGFAINEAGEKYGRTAAAFSLLFQKENGLSLYPILGATNSPSGEHRVPLTRYKILKSLLDGRKREIDFVRDLGINLSAVQASLKALSEAGVITYQSLKPQTGKEQVSFNAIGDIPVKELPTIKRERTFPKAVAKVCNILAKEGFDITRQAVYDHLPRRLRRRLRKSAVSRRISTVLSYFEKAGYLQRGPYKTHESYSEAKINGLGRLVVENFLLPLEDALSDGPMLEVLRREILPKVMAGFPEYAREAADIYYPYSISYKRRHYAERQGNVMLALSRNRRTGLTASDCAGEVGEKTPTVRTILRQLAASGKAQAVVLKSGVVRYYTISRRPRQQIAS